MKSLILISLTPIFYIVVYRQLLPLYWYYSFEGEAVDQYTLIYISHIVYLFLQLIFNSFIIFYLYTKIIIRPRLKDFSKNCHTEALSMKIISIFVLAVFFMKNTLPILSGLNSEILVQFHNSKKILTLLGFGVLGILSTYAMISFAYRKTKRFKWALLIAAFPAVASAKKAALLVFFQDLTLLLLLSRVKFDRTLILKLIAGVVIAGVFGVIIYLQTEKLGFGDVVTVLNIVLDMYYASSTSYLNIFWQDLGYSYASQYRESIGSPVSFQYLANPFLKVLGFEGIEYSIGPYLSNIFNSGGSGGILTGVNPTLFFEMAFVMGDAAGIAVAYILLIIIYLFLFKVISRLGRSQPGDVIDLCIWWEIYKLLISIQFDVLNGYKSSFIAISLLLILRFILRLRLKRPKDVR